jgi:hypothetical protein
LGNANIGYSLLHPYVREGGRLQRSQHRYWKLYTRRREIHELQRVMKMKQLSITPSATQELHDSHLAFKGRRDSDRYQSANPFVPSTDISLTLEELQFGYQHMMVMMQTQQKEDDDDEHDIWKLQWDRWTKAVAAAASSPSNSPPLSESTNSSNHESKAIIKTTTSSSYEGKSESKDSDDKTLSSEIGTTARPIPMPLIRPRRSTWLHYASIAHSPRDPISQPLEVFRWLLYGDSTSACCSRRCRVLISSFPLSKTEVKCDPNIRTTYRIDEDYFEFDNNPDHSVLQLLLTPEVLDHLHAPHWTSDEAKVRSDAYNDAVKVLAKRPNLITNAQREAALAAKAEWFVVGVRQSRSILFVFHGSHTFQMGMQLYCRRVSQ